MCGNGMGCNIRHCRALHNYTCRCWLHFVNTLLLEGLQDEAEEYIRTSTFKVHTILRSRSMDIIIVADLAT